MAGDHAQHVSATTNGNFLNNRIGISIGSTELTEQQERLSMRGAQNC